MQLNIFREFDFYFLSIIFHDEFGSVWFNEVFMMESEFRDIFFTDQGCGRAMVNKCIKCQESDWSCHSLSSANTNVGHVAVMCP